MKMITAMIQPFMLNKVTVALEDIESFPGMTVADVRGFGRLNGGENQHASSFSDFHPKARLEIVATDEMADLIVKTIAERARTGKHGDGKIFVSTIDDAVRVRTGETGETAI